MTHTINTTLIIDDNEINRKYFKTVLSNKEIKPILASNGSEALSYLEDHRPDLILVDIQMPKMDGFECFERIKKSFGIFCPILAVTAFSNISDRNQILNFGFHDFIQKPVKPQVLLDTILYWLENGIELNSNRLLSDEAHIDHTVLDELISFTDLESVITLIDEFIEETKSQVQSITFLKSSKDYSKILSILHVIKGNAGSFGFVHLSAKSAHIEEQIREGKLQTINLDLEEFITYANFLLRDYHRLLKLN